MIRIHKKRIEYVGNKVNTSILEEFWELKFEISFEQETFLDGPLNKRIKEFMDYLLFLMILILAHSISNLHKTKSKIMLVSPIALSLLKLSFMVFTKINVSSEPTNCSKSSLKCLLNIPAFKSCCHFTTSYINLIVDLNLLQ